MADIMVHTNPDGTARVTLVDGETKELIEEFGWAVNAFRDDNTFIVQLETLDGTQGETVTTVNPQDVLGARDKAIEVLMGKAIKEGYTIERAHLGNDDDS